MMSQEQFARLERLKNRGTAYEIVATRGDERILIGYTRQHSRSGLLSACRHRGEKIIAALGITDTDMLIPAKRAQDGFSLGPWQVRFSGRSQRDAILLGELPYVGDLAEAKQQTIEVIS